MGIIIIGASNWRLLIISVNGGENHQGEELQAML